MAKAALWLAVLCLAGALPLLVKRGCRAAVEFDAIKARTNAPISKP